MSQSTAAQPTVIHSTFVIEHSFAVSPEKVFEAFSNIDKKRRWMASERGMAVEHYEMDFRVGGFERAHYRFPEGSPFPGALLVNTTVYQDIIPNKRIVIAYTMSFGDKPFSASLGTFEFLPGANGTDLIFTEQGAFFENSDGPKMREEGWSKLIDRLAAELVR